MRLLRLNMRIFLQKTPKRLENFGKVYYNRFMERKPETRTMQKVRRKAALKLVLRCSRTALLCLAGVAAGGFVVLPASFAFQATPTPYNGNVVISGTPIPSMAVIPTPTPYVPERTPNQAESVVKDVGAQGDVAYQKLQFGDSTEAVMSVQSRLMELGYFDSDEPTEYFGPATEAAAKLFQHAHHMAETGIADEAFQSVLFSDIALPYVMEEGDDGSDVQKLQNRLDELGYFEGNINGYFGTATLRALKAFQVKNGLADNGIADAQTRELLFSPSAKPKIDPTPTPKPTKKPTPTPSAKATKKPSATSTPSSSGWNTTPSATSSSGGSSGIPITGSGVSGMIEAAKAQLGDPYVWSEEGPDSYDCSGLVYYCLRSVGVSTGRYTAAGFSQVSSWQTIGSTSELQVGDLIFFKSDSSTRISHTGIWLGGNSYIHASSTAGKVIISSWSAWAERNFMLGKRVFG